MTTIRIKLPKITDVDFSIDAELDDTPIRGNAMVSGNDADDTRVEDEIINSVNSGNIWAWASVRVTALFRGMQGVDYLGCCSYENAQDFIKNSGYYEDMKQAAYNDLINGLKSLGDRSNKVN